ncbi:sensor histidine kinase [Methylobacterium oryzihabitans]|uniref:histidine kinase n=1 Tax=Methylobacterium oryzihabitans TaxID=2499852 RepID=A0A3S2V4D6_9HYPH|nr:histidine kinase dimerization/phosphoacceptor domain -containing protein [Methylobacterium oryzihabitans]RVU13962.1 GAF domain-containing protein [Methylobacterium oryzihabitans]
MPSPREDAVLPPPTPATPLDLRLRQQMILSQFGVEALREPEIHALLQRATELCAEGMQAQFCKALEYKPGRDTLLVCAGVGWGPDVIGRAVVGADLASPAGFALKTGQPVISNHLENETRFRTPKLMADHGVRRAINVLISNRDGHYGVLEVDDAREGVFEEGDVAFMQGFANLLGGAIERQRSEARLREAVERQELLSREMSHRVKNSLSIVAGLLTLQARASENADVRAALADAQTRVEAVAQVHDQLWREPGATRVRLPDFLGTLVGRLGESAPHHTVTCRVPDAALAADTAIPLGLYVNELVTNAIKYAYPSGGGPVRVEAEQGPDGALRLVVADDGVGMPAGFDIATFASKSLGMRVVTRLARQLGGHLAVPAGRGATFVLDLPAGTVLAKGA